MKIKILTVLAGIALAGAAHAQGDEMTGDAEAGERAFNQCKSCHTIVDDEGEIIVRGGRVGPNLYGVVGRAAGAVEDFRYSDSLAEAGEAGLVWDEESFAAYAQDPTAFLREYLEDDGARGKMTFRLRREEDAADIWAYIASVGPSE